MVYWYACLAVAFYLWRWACTEVLVWCCQELSDLVWLDSGVILSEFVGVSAEEAVAQHLACVEDVSPAEFLLTSCNFVGFVPFLYDGFGSGVLEDYCGQIFFPPVVLCGDLELEVSVIWDGELESRAEVEGALVLLTLGTGVCEF